MDQPINQITDAITLFRALVACVGLAVFSYGMLPRERVWLPGGWRYLGSLTHFQQLACKVLPFAAMICAVVAIKLSKLQFFYDMGWITSIFALYLFWTRRCVVRTSIYMAVIVFLCSDFCVAVFNMFYIAGIMGTNLLLTVLVEGLFALLLVMLCRVLRRYAPLRPDIPVPWRGFISLLLSLLPYIFIRSTSFLYDLDGNMGTAMQVILLLTIVSTFGTVAGNYSAIDSEAEKARRLQTELQMFEQRSRYQVRRETIAEVNRRYHDMLKYARTCAQMGKQGSLNDYLEQRMTQDISCAALTETGNDILDAVLWDASQRCETLGIRVIPSIDPVDLSFIEDFDLRCIVGNALDNAIEASQDVSESQRREIKLRISQASGMVFFKVTNYYDGEIHNVSGRLLTTKGDEGLHGYGVENMRLTAQRYGGSLVFDADAGLFTLTAMIPQQ